METYISLVGIVIAFCTLIFLMMRGVNLFITVMIASLIAIVSGNMNIYKTLTENYMTGFADYYRSYYLVFFCGTLLGTTMELSGAATSIAKWVTGKFKSMAYLAIPLATGIICYGGVTAIISIFATFPIALAIFRENNIPRRLMPAALYFGSCTFAMIAPGAPQVQNIIPTQGFGVDLMAGTVVGFISSILMLLIGSFWLSVMIKNAKKAGEVFTSRDDDKDEKSGSLPSPLISFIPMLVTVIAINLKNKAGENIIPIEYALLMGIATTIILMYRRFDRAELTEAVFQSVPKAAVAIFNICTIVGFGTVIKSTPAFELLVDAVIHIPGNYLVGVSVGTALLAGFCGSASGGLGIITPIFYDIFGAMQGVSYAAIARVMAIASSSLDSLPHSGSVNTSIGLCGESHKSAYIPIFCLSVVPPAICTAVAVILFTLFPGWP